MELLPYGAAVRSIYVPDRNGKMTDICLGYDELESYRHMDACFGGTIGRCANRIGGAAFSIDGTAYRVAANEGRNCLHGGNEGFHKKLWDFTCAENAVTFTYTSPDGEEGFPGAVRVEVTYRLADSTLTIAYRAAAEKDTVVNLTNHAYFNLSGHQHPEQAMVHTLWLNATQYTPADETGIPTGEIADVSGTCLDFTEGRSLSAPPTPPGGYDHNFVLAGNPAAVLSDPASGRKLTVITDRPGLQLYSGNYLNVPGKDGVFYGPRSGICLETQFYPDSIHHPHWPQPIAKADCTYHSITAYCCR